MRRTNAFGFIETTIIVLVLSLTSCAQGVDAKSPAEAVEEYFRSLSSGNMEAAVFLLADSDAQAFKNRTGEDERVVLAGIWERSNWTILDEQVDGKLAQVQVELRMPDLSELLGSQVSNELASAYVTVMDAVDRRESQTLIDKLVGESFGYVKTRTTIELRLQDSKWKIILNLEKASQTNAKIKKAIELIRDGKDGEARRILEEVIHKDGTNVLAKEIYRRMESKK